MIKRVLSRGTAWGKVLGQERTRNIRRRERNNEGGEVDVLRNQNSIFGALERLLKSSELKE